MTDGVQSVTKIIRTHVDIGFAGFTINVLVFTVVSILTKPLDPEHVETMRREMEE